VAQIEKVGNVYYRVTDFPQAFEFYANTLGLTLKLRDADRWAQFDVAGVALAIEPASAAGSAGRGGATVSLRVSGGLDEMIAELRAKGATVSDAEDGAHERRSLLNDPSGNELVLYEPLKR
jgi:catechol 2,3-dioxygenase-like lactoylglutathione lyase family enzyme